MTDIAQMIDREIRKASLSAETFDALNAELTKGRDAAKQLEVLQKRHEETTSELTSERARAGRLSETVDALKKDTENLRKAELDAAVATAKADTIRECFSLVFRNTAVRKNVFDDVPVPVTYGDGDHTSTHVERHTKSTNTETEEV